MTNFNLTSATLNQRNEKKPLNLMEITKNKNFSNYGVLVEKIRLAVSTIATASVNNHEPARIKEFETHFYNVYKEFLAMLEVDNGEALKASANDLTALIAMVGNWRKNQETGKKEFLPTGRKTFRKNFEVFVAMRISGELCKETAEIESARKAKKEAKKAERKEMRRAAHKTQE